VHVICFIANAKARVTVSDKPKFQGDNERNHSIYYDVTSHTFGNCNNDESDRNNKDLYKTHGFLICGAIRLCPELDKESNHQRDEQEQASQASNFHDQLHESVQFQL